MRRSVLLVVLLVLMVSLPLAARADPPCALRPVSELLCEPDLPTTTSTTSTTQQTSPPSTTQTLPTQQQQEQTPPSTTQTLPATR